MPSSLNYSLIGVRSIKDSTPPLSLSVLSSLSSAGVSRVFSPTIISPTWGAMLVDGRDGGSELGRGGGGVDDGKGGRAVSTVVCSSIQGYSSLGRSLSSKLRK